MKARIEKKLSKRLATECKSLFPDAWIDKYESSELAYEQGTRVKNVYSVGGGLDYWGEAEDAYTCWDSFVMNWPWLFDFPSYPEGHELEYYPDTTGFKRTTINLLKEARKMEKRNAN